jgi:hypothetical protein
MVPAIEVGGNDKMKWYRGIWGDDIGLLINGTSFLCLNLIAREGRSLSN